LAHVGFPGIPLIGRGLARTNRGLARTNRRLARTNRRLARSNRQLARSNHQLARSNRRLARSKRQLARSNRQLVRSNRRLARTNRRFKHGLFYTMCKKEINITDPASRRPPARPPRLSPDFTRCRFSKNPTTRRFEKSDSIAETRKGGNAESHENQALQNNFRVSILPRLRD
jgi:hypothetical protein